MKSIVSFKAVFAALMAVFLAGPTFAGYSLGGSSSGPFGKLTQWMQDYVDFMDGPAALAIIVVSIIIAVCAWIWAPKSGAVGILVRVVIGGIVILNIGTWVVSFV